MNIGRRILQLREERHWTQAHLAELIGTSERYIGHLETGYRKPGRDNLIALAAAFGVAVDTLLADPQPPDAQDAPAAPIALAS